MFITTSMFLALSNWILFISLMQSLNSVQFLNTTSLFQFVNLLAILLPIKEPVDSAVFWIALFEVVLSASVTDFLAWSKSFWLYLLLKFWLIF